MHIFNRYQGVVFAEIGCQFVACIFADRIAQTPLNVNIL